jgi:3-oxoacyl-(acyl-carrier-protein) synthase
LKTPVQEKPSFVDLVPLKGQIVENNSRRSGNGKGLRYALSNSFGFGGTNASLVFRRYEK